MYSLLIYENKTAVECHLQREDKEISFDATIEVFETLNGTGKIIEFTGTDGADEHSRIEAIRHIENLLQERAGLKDIEIEMGYSGVSFPITAYGAEYPVYKCDNIQSVVLCVLRYLLVNGYKFTHCKHCGRPFATKNLRTLYCNRNSTYKGYERYNCKDAVKHINDFLEKRRKTVYERLRTRAEEYGYHSKHGETLRTFQEECTKHKAAAKKEASVSNLSAYSTYLQSGEGLPKRYERIKEVRR